MSILGKIKDVSIGIGSDIEAKMWDIEASNDIRKSKKDKFYYLKKHSEYVEDDVKNIEAEILKNDPMILTRLYCMAYISYGSLNTYLYGNWMFGEIDYLDCLTDDSAIKNKLKKLLVDYFLSDKNDKKDDDETAYFEKAKHFMDLIDNVSDCDTVIADIEKLFKGSNSRTAVAISKVRTYIKKKEAELNGDDEGNESLAKSLDDLI